MAKYRRIVLAALLVAVLAGIAIYLLRQAIYSNFETASVAPDSPQQPILAREHARCLAFYRYALGAKTADAETLSDLNKGFERHGRIGLSLSPDKKFFAAQVEAETTELQKELQAGASLEHIASVVRERETACANTMLRSGRFLQEVMAKHAN